MAGPYARLGPLRINLSLPKSQPAAERIDGQTFDPTSSNRNTFFSIP